MLNKTEGSLLYEWTDKTTYNNLTRDTVRQCKKKAAMEMDMGAICPLSV